MTSTTTLTQEDFLTVSEIRSYLKISLSAAYGLANSKDFPVCRINGNIRIPKAAFLAWVEQRTSIPALLNDYMSRTQGVS